VPDSERLEYRDLLRRALRHLERIANEHPKWLYRREAQALLDEAARCRELTSKERARMYGPDVTAVQVREARHGVREELRHRLPEWEG